jgi:endo-beta-N-acetylglucosaminidase D
VTPTQWVNAAHRNGVPVLGTGGGRVQAAGARAEDRLHLVTKVAVAGGGDWLD